MRKAQKKQAEDFLKLLADAHDELKKYIENGNYEGASGLLGECQRGAIELGGLIEKTEGENHVSVLLLEDYCETLYQIHEQIAGNQKLNANKVHKRIRQLLIKIENSIKNDIRLKIEIAFMPYKASMWDSLESIWEAAKQDKDCDAYVIPIPYYNRNPDFSLGQYHYEGMEFPEYVEIVDYNTYHLESRRPDIIYIHNPYDEHNYVTSVAPQYYSYKLKEYTEQLVYVPYCIYEEPNLPDSRKTIEFCSRYVSSGILHADKVILQSENFRRAVINAMLTYQGMNKAFWEEKIVALGSPKYDKVINEDINKLCIPDSWEKLIKRPDGSRKQVIFYNTSLNALLQYDEQMNRKIRSVLRLFYENREKCTLLWRPHPLVKATIESMRPKLWAEYREIVETYKKEGWGIYDDTPDFHAAFAVSDAYYGDFSSLLLLYQATGKPALWQNADIVDYGKRLVTDRLYYDGEYVWGTALEFNGLFRLDPDTYEIKYMGQFPDENPEGYRLFYGIAECGGKLYFCPHNAKHIGVYDKETTEFYTINLKEEIRDIDKKFCSILAYGKYVYLQGSRVYTIAQLDTETEEIIYIDHWTKELKERQSGNFEFILQRDGCLHNGKLYYFCPDIRSLLQISLNNLSYKFISIPSGMTNNFLEIISSGRDVWLLPYSEGFISCFDLRTLTLTELVQMDGAVSSCKVNEYIYCFSRTEPYFYRVHTESKKVDKFSAGTGVYCACPVKDKIFITTYLTGELYVFDTISCEIVKPEIQLGDTKTLILDSFRMLEENKKYNQYVCESAFLNLSNLLEKGSKETQLRQGSEKSVCGESIHKYVKGLIK